MNFDLDTLETSARDRVQGWFDLAGIDAAFPVSSDTAVKVLRAVQYALSHDRLLQLLQTESVPPVPRHGGKFAFSATNLIAVAAACEARRWWQRFSTLHQHKFSIVERIQHVCDDPAKAINDLAEYDLDFLIGLLHRTAGDQATTAMLADAIKLKWQMEQDAE